MTAGTFVAAIWTAIADADTMITVCWLVAFVVLSVFWMIRYKSRAKPYHFKRDKHFEAKTLYLAELADSEGYITGRVIENCTVYGPGVLMTYLGDETSFQDCEWLPPGSPAGWAVAIPHTDPSGSIRLRRTVFRGCRFFNVGVNTGPMAIERIPVPIGHSLESLLIHKTWRLHFNSSRSKELRFGAGGQIVVGANHNESSWVLDNSTLLLLRPDGSIHNRFVWNLSNNRFVSTNSHDVYAVSTHRIRDQFLEMSS